jgi:hypothetical protein
MLDKLFYTRLGNKLNSTIIIIDSIFVWADTALERIRQSTDRNIPRLQGWLFTQNQKLHGVVDVSSLCNNNDDDEEESRVVIVSSGMQKHSPEQWLKETGYHDEPEEGEGENEEKGV